jgi:RNase_H superfamily
MGGRVTEPKILTLDIETAPLKVYAWGLWDQNTGVNQIDTEWSILAVCAKWLGKPPMYADCRGEPLKDLALLEWTHSLLDDADIVVTQNGLGFDIKKLNARFIAEGFDPYSPVRHIDTKLVAKKHFGFTSNRLEWMGKNIAGQKKSDHKKFPGFELWSECLKDNLAAWKEMEKYNKQDVISTEALYLKMRPWIEGHPNLAAYHGEEIHRCPKCDSSDLQHRGFATTQFGRYQRYQCLECGGWSRGGRTLLAATKKKSLLTN